MVAPNLAQNDSSKLKLKMVAQIVTSLGSLKGRNKK